MKHDTPIAILFFSFLVLASPDGLAQNTALEFDGGDDQVSVTDHDSLNLTANATWSCWVKPDNTGNQCLFSTFSTFDEDGYYINYHSSYLYFSQGTPGGTLIQTSTAANSLTPGLWQHIAVVKSGSTVTIYRNGVDITSSHGNHVDLVTNGQSLILG